MGKRRIEREIDRDTVLSWTMANFTRAPKLPELGAWLARIGKGRRPQTPQEYAQEQFMVMQRLSAELGVPIRKVKRGR